ncbi:MAG TPA: type IV pilus twitching motility protein PilT [Actinomycetota bacterium]|nr:type IV pilus twitching motility protein PilT [Actinomycetota bacterium]
MSTEPAQPAHVPDARMISLLEEVVSRKGSDLHLTPGIPPVVRVHGRLVRLQESGPLETTELRSMLYSILSQRQIDTFEEELELDFSFSLPGKARFRANVFYQRDSVGGAFRLIPAEIKSIQELGLPSQIADFTEMNRGLVLVTGPTGQGKTTTLATMIGMINQNRDTHIVTIEDPIEFVHDHKMSVVNQREVGTDTHSFSEALRRALRQDPDVILVGEMRDLETISTALTAAETGHLVFATLHTQDAAQTVDRVIDVFPPQQQEQVRVQLAGSLQGVVVQYLLPLTQGGGRVPAVEIMFATPAIRNLIREGKSHQINSALQAGGRHGMQTMDQALADLYRSRKISFETAMERASDSETLKQLLGK